MQSIAVIVPVYNAELSLEKCINSILAQTFKDFELILVNDGSSDSSLEICKRYEAIDNRIIVIHQENMGVSVARNVGIEYALSNPNCKWITFIDSDDWIMPEYMELLYSMADNSKAEITVGGMFCTNGENPTNDGFDSNFKEISPEQYWCDYHHINATSPCVKLYKKELWQELRFPVGKRHEDSFAVWKALFATEKIAVIDKQIYCYYMNQNSFSHSRWNVRQLDVIEAIEEQLEYFEAHNYKNALYFSADDYVFSVNNNLKEFKKMEQTEEITAIIAELEEKRKKAISYYKGLKVPFKEHEWVYLILYPLPVKIVLSLKNKLRKLGFKK